MDEGFILSNKYRRAIFDEFVAGETNIDQIAKKHHIVRIVAKRVLNDFIEGGIIKEKQNNKYVFTEKGQKLVETMGK